VDQRGEPFASLIQEAGGAHEAEARGWGLNCFVFVPRVVDGPTWSCHTVLIDSSPLFQKGKWK
jgi:hypothetical protein